MAEATKIEVEHLTTEVIGVDIRLNQEEVQTLADLLSRVGGNMYSSRRKHSQALLNALTDAGFPYENSTDLADSNSIYFAETNATPTRNGCGCA